MVAFLASLIITGIMVGIVVMVAKRRPPDQRLTWGEAFVASTFIFTLLFMLYGVVPHQWLAWADNELNWRSDVFFPKNGVSFFGRGRITIPLQVYRDLIVLGIYGVALGMHIFGWLWWQRRGQRRAESAAAIETSKFGRPLLKAAD